MEDYWTEFLIYTFLRVPVLISDSVTTKIDFYSRVATHQGQHL